MSHAVVFDIDDTLYLERDYVRSGFLAVGDHVREKFGVTGFAEMAWRLFLKGKRGRIFNEAMAALNVHDGDAHISELVAIYRAHDPRIALLSDSSPALKELVDRNVLIAIITDGPSLSQWAKVAALGLERYASTIVVTEDLGMDMGKPNEAAFLLVQERLGLAGKSLTYVADNPNKDFVAPYRLGWGTVRIRRRGGLHESVESRGDVQAEHSDLRPLLVLHRE